MAKSIPVIKVINERIESLPINRAELARRIELDNELLRRSLNGDRKLNGDEFVRICFELGLKMDDFKPKGVA